VGVDWFKPGSGQRPVVDCFEHGIEPSDFIKSSWRPISFSRTLQWSFLRDMFFTKWDL